MKNIEGLTLPYLQEVIKAQFPTSPHHLFENKKNYAQFKKKVDEVYDAEFNIQMSARRLNAALIPMGMNFHFYNYLSTLYGQLFKAIKEFEKVISKTIPELKLYYENHSIPPSKGIYDLMKVEFELLKPLVEKELNRARAENFRWSLWDENKIYWEIVNINFKKASKDTQ